MTFEAIRILNNSIFARYHPHGIGFKQIIRCALGQATNHLALHVAHGTDIGGSKSTQAGDELFGGIPNVITEQLAIVEITLEDGQLCLRDVIEEFSMRIEHHEIRLGTSPEM